MKTGEFCNREVVVAPRDMSILEAAKMMRHYHVGNLVVVEENNGLSIPVGIFTDRDIVVELLAGDVDPALFSIDEVMTFELTTAPEEEDIIDTVKKMKERGIRRIPVVDDKNHLIGILALEDVIELIAEELSDLVALCRTEQKMERINRP
jgi:CBS domain-containing protein